MPNKPKKKIRLKEPIKLICPIAVVLASIITSLILGISSFWNILLLMVAAALVYIFAFTFFEKHRMASGDFYTEDLDDEDAYLYEVQKETISKYEHSRPAVPSQPKRPERRPTAPPRKDFDVIKSAVFSDTEEEESLPEPLQEEDSWRSMYNKNTGDMGLHTQSGVEEDYRKYFSTALPDREEILEAQRNIRNIDNPTPVRKTAPPSFQEEKAPLHATAPFQDIKENREADGVSAPMVHPSVFLEPEEIETQTAEIQNQISSLLESDEEEQNNLLNSVTSKLKLFQKSRNPEVVEYEDDGAIRSDMSLIDALYENPDPSKYFEDVDSDTGSLPVVEEMDSVPAEPLGTVQLSSEETEEDPGDAKTEERMHFFLEELEVDAKIKSIQAGASITRYEIETNSISGISKIRRHASDLERILRKRPLRLFENIADKTRIYIEVPNAERVIVPFKELIHSRAFQNAPSNTTCLLGTDAAQKLVLAELQTLTHVLVADTSGTEKNQCMQAMITGILSRIGVFDTDFVMIDTRKKTLGIFDGIPNLACPVLYTAKDALSELSSLNNQANLRLSLFERENVSNITEYNASRPDNPLAQIIVFITELEDLIKKDLRQTEEMICSLAQSARAAGIYLVIGTSNPSESVLTGLIRANIPSRIAFRLETEVESVTVLDIPGGEKLLGEGDLLYSPRGSSEPIRIQGVTISEDDIHNLVQSIK